MSDTEEVGEISKLSVATIGAQEIAKEFVGVEGGKETVCARIFGIASGVKIKKLANGDNYEMIVGNFEAMNMVSGESFSSAVLYLPSGLHEKIAEPLKAGDADSIEFAIELSAYPVKRTKDLRNDGNPNGYAWKARPLKKVGAADPLASIRGEATKDVTLVKPVKPAAPKKK